MADKYVSIPPSGVPAPKEAITVSTGVPDAGRIIAANADGQVDLSFIPATIGQQSVNLQSSMNLDAGRFVNIFDDGGVTRVRYASATTGLHAHGFVLDTVAPGVVVAVYFEGLNDRIAGVVAGDVFLSHSGLVSNTPVSTIGHISQKLGAAFSATAMYARIEPYYIV